MEFPTPDNAQNQLYPFTVNVQSQRNNERFPAAAAHQALLRPYYTVEYDASIDSYRITFKGVWRRINLPFTYFQNIRPETKQQTQEETLAEFEAAVAFRLQPVVDIVKHYVQDTRPEAGCDFAALSFWEAVRCTLFPRYMRPLRVVADSFRLGTDDSEVMPAIRHAQMMGEIINFGNHEIILMPTQTSIYYDNPAMLLRLRDFRVVSVMEDKMVGWFLDRDLTQIDIEAQYKLPQDYPRYLAYYHANQNLNWPHIFIFPKEDNVYMAQLYNVYRNWRMLHQIQVLQQYDHIHLTYAYGGVHFDRGLLYQVMSTCPYPKDFSPITYNNADRMHEAVMSLLNNMPINDKTRIMSMRDRFLRPSVAEYITRSPETVFDRRDFSVIFWTGIRIIEMAMHEGDSKANRLMITALPNPEDRVPDFEVKDASSFINLDYKWDWAVSATSFFTSVILPIASAENPELLEEFGSLNDYRLTWNDFRNMTSRPRSNMREINEKTLTDVFGENVVNEVPANTPVHEMIERMLLQEPTKRVSWNNSTAKLLGVVEALYSSHILDMGVRTKYEVQFFGVIAEPVQELMKLVPERFDVRPGIGAQARDRNQRTDVASLLYQGTPHVIISDMDQSEEVDEQAIGELASSQIIHLLEYAQITLAYKLQYTTPTVLNIIQARISQKRYNDIFMVKPLASGVFSLETYLIFSKGDAKTFNPSLIEDWVQDRAVFLSPKPDIIKGFRVKSIVSSAQALASLAEPQYYYYMFRAKNQREYKNALNAAAAISEQVNILPVGDVTNYELFVYGSRWRKRTNLTRRVGRVSEVRITQGGDKFPSSGPTRSSRLPLTLSHGVPVIESAAYNYAIKRRIVQEIAEVYGPENYRQPKNLFDIGGRACEGVSFTAPEWNYTVMDRHSLPAFMDQYNVQHIDEYTDWEDLTPFENADIVTCIFVLMNADSAEAQYARIEFLKRLGAQGKTVIFNYYSNTRAQAIDERHHRAIHYFENYTKGTFGNYENTAPFLLDDTNDAFNDTMMLKIGVPDCISAQIDGGLSIETELINWLRDFNDFCPLRRVGRR